MTTIIATGASARAIRFSCSAAKCSSAKPAPASASISRRDINPKGIARPAVRGLRRSCSASISRLAAIAPVRAPAIATVIQKKVRQPGNPSAASTIPR